MFIYSRARAPGFRKTVCTRIATALSPVCFLSVAGTSHAFAFCTRVVLAPHCIFHHIIIYRSLVFHLPAHPRC